MPLHKKHTERFEMRMTPKQKERLEQVAAEREMSAADLVRKSIDRLKTREELEGES